VVSEEPSVVAQVDLMEVLVATVWSIHQLNIDKLLAQSTGLSHTSMEKKLDTKDLEVQVEVDIYQWVVVERSSCQAGR